MAVLSVDEYRIIPTRVGTSRPRPALLQGVGDHPHACGDKVCENYYVGDGVGSSPRVWGQVEQLQYYTTKARIIPTRVGTREVLQLLGLHRRDHPHACGDKLICQGIFANLKGSSPRVWGQVCTVFYCFVKSRIIPTRVGTSMSAFLSRVPVKDHPHACGDKHLTASGYRCKKGSSPRVWGQDMFMQIW